MAKHYKAGKDLRNGETHRRFSVFAKLSRWLESRVRRSRCCAKEPTIATHTQSLWRTLPRLGTGAALALVTVLMAPAQALAEDPFPLEGAYIVDDPGVLGNRITDVSASLDAFADEGVNLFVVIVDRFTGVGLDDSWAGAMAELNRLGDRDILFAIAVTDRNFDISIPDNFELSKAETDRLE